MTNLLEGFVPDDFGNSRLPVCEHLAPRLRETGQDWLVELARWYESGWNLALSGAPRPSADSVVRWIPPEHQQQVREVLNSIDSRYASMVDRQTPGDDGRGRTTTADVQDSERNADAALEADTASRSGETVSLRGMLQDSSVDPAILAVTIDAAASAGLPPTPIRASDHGSSEDLDDPTVARPAVRLGRGGSPISSSPGSIEIPGYKIQGVLGRGGMGIVYLAHQQGIDRPVALKMILSRGHVDQVALDRFYAEARAIGRFQHENIVRIYDAGDYHGMPYFSLEYVDGKSLAEQLQGRPMEPVEAARLLEPLARAIQKAHDAGVIHRDLKPANVLMTRDGVPKITDFGLAKELEKDRQLSQDGTVLGTPAFMSPEQARGSRDVGPLADVYGLGAVLYCLLTGRPPFQGAKTTDTLLQVINNEPVNPIRLQPAIPKDLETICLKCLQKDPAQRYEDANGLADDVGRFLRGEPIHARPVGRAERVWRWCKRNPMIATASSAAAALALVVIIGGPVSAAVIYGQKKEVVAAKDQAEDNAQLAADRAEEAVQARQIAETNAEAASVQERNAIDTLRSMIFQVQREMSGQTNLVNLRQSLVQIVKNGLGRIRDNENTVRERNMIAAIIHVRLGEINLEIGQFREALEDCQKCLAIFEELDAAGDLKNREHNFSKIHELIGEAYRMMGQLGDADEHYQKSLEIRRSWVAAFPKIDSRTALTAHEAYATSMGKVGSLAQVTGDLPRARESMEEAVKVRQQIFQALRNADNLIELLGAKLVLGKVIFQQGDADAGIELLTTTANQARQQAADNASSDAAQHRSAMFDSELAVMLLYVGQTEAAREIFERSANTLERLLDRDPYNSYLQEDLEEALYGTLVARRKAGETENNHLIDQLLSLRRSAVEQDPENHGKQLRLLVALARCGRIAEANELVEKLRDQIDRTDPLNYDLACAYAQLAAARSESDRPSEELPLAKEYQEGSVEALRGLLEGGFDRPTDLKLDPDLDPIRETEAFQQLVKG